MLAGVPFALASVEVAKAGSIRNCFTSVLRLQFAQDILYVCLDRVLRDRQNLANDGMFVIIAVVDRKTGRVRGSPDIISRGFIYLRESKDLLREVRKRTINIVNKSSGTGGAVNWVYVRDNVRNEIGDFLFKKTERRPMVLPVIIEI